MKLNILNPFAIHSRLERIRAKEKYEGEMDWLGRPSGTGMMVYANDDKYEGEFLKGQKNGSGRMFCPSNKTIYEGEWKNDKRDGEGILTYRVPPQYARNEENFLRGKWTQGQLEDGYGTIPEIDGTYIGQVKNYERHGEGKFFSITREGYSGEWEEGEIKKYKKLFYPNNASLREEDNVIIFELLSKDLIKIKDGKVTEFKDENIEVYPRGIEYIQRMIEKFNRQDNHKPSGRKSIKTPKLVSYDKAQLRTINVMTSLFFLEEPKLLNHFMGYLEEINFDNIKAFCNEIGQNNVNYSASLEVNIAKPVDWQINKGKWEDHKNFLADFVGHNFLNNQINDGVQLRTSKKSKKEPAKIDDIKLEDIDKIWESSESIQPQNVKSPGRNPKLTEVTAFSFEKYSVPGMPGSM